MKTQTNTLIRPFLFLASLTTVLLLIPFIAMQFSTEVVWTLSDFLFAGFLIFGTGYTYIILTNKLQHRSYKIALSIALGTSFLLIWVNGAVGIIGSESQAANVLYGLVLLAGLVGGITSRFKPAGLHVTMIIMGAIQAFIPVLALIIWPPETQTLSWGSAGIGKTILFNSIFAGLFILSGFLFKKSAE